MEAMDTVAMDTVAMAILMVDMDAMVVTEDDKHAVNLLRQQ